MSLDRLWGQVKLPTTATSPPISPRLDSLHSYRLYIRDNSHLQVRSYIHVPLTTGRRLTSYPAVPRSLHLPTTPNMADATYPPLEERPLKDTICLFDVDGTLTPARLVSRSPIALSHRSNDAHTRASKPPAIPTPMLTTPDHRAPPPKSSPSSAPCAKSAPSASSAAPTSPSRRSSSAGPPAPPSPPSSTFASPRTA